jgi:PAS domain S-box-containing protein
MTFFGIGKTAATVPAPSDHPSGPSDVVERVVQINGRFRALVEHATELVVVWNNHGDIVYRNPAAIRFAHGGETRAHGDLVPLTDLGVHPDDRAYVEDVVHELRHRRGDTARFVARYLRFDGVPRWLEVTLSNQLGDPAVRGMVAYSRDITTQHETQEALRESEAHFKALVEFSSDLVAVVDADGTMLRPSPTHVLSYPVGSLVGRSTLDLIHPDDMALAEATLARAKALPGEPLEIELRIRESDATWRFFHVTVTNRLEDRAVGGFVVNGRDVTESREAEEVLRASEARFRRLFERAPDVIYRWRLGAQPGFEYLSPSVERLTGYTVEELCGDSALAINVLHPDDLTLVARVLEHGDLSVPYTVRWRHRDGDLTWVECHVEPIRDRDGVPVAIEGIARDVPARVRA